MPFWEHVSFRDKKTAVMNGDNEELRNPNLPPNGVAIRGPSNFVLNRSDNSANRIPLPSFEIGPVDPELAPQLEAVAIDISSSNEELRVAIDKAYRSHRKIGKKLNQPVSISGGELEWSAKTPISSSVELVIGVRYRPRDESGKLEADTEIVRTRFQMFSGESVRPQRTVRVRPRNLLKVFERESRGFGPRLIIETSLVGELAKDGDEEANAAFQVAPDLQIQAADLETVVAQWGCMSLEASVRNMLSAIGAPTKNSTNGTFTWRKILQIELSADDRETIVRQLRADPTKRLCVPIVIKVDGAEDYRLEIEVHPKMNIRDGLLGVDLGNSSSTTAVLDPSIVDEAEVPREHFEEVHNEFLELIRFSTEDIATENQSYWAELLGEVCRCNEIGPGADPAEALCSHVQASVVTASHSEKLYRTLGYFERQMWNLAPNASDVDGQRLGIFQTRLCNELHRIYHRVFETVPLKSWSVELIRREGDVSDYTSSEMELVDVLPLPYGVMGGEVPQRRIAWMSGQSQTKPEGVIQKGRFFECPKRFLSVIDDDRDLTSERDSEFAIERVTRSTEDDDGSEDPTEISLAACDIVQAAINGLIDPKNDASGKMNGINQVVATYPADLRPETRQRLEQSVRELGMTGVFLEFDESISPAIFHLEQLFGNVEEVGCEAFKVKCVNRGKDYWTHDLLVLDIGAGTTDVSLIRIELTELQPRKSEYGGVKYEIAPRLLGAAGRSQAGGHQLTLGIFRILKQVLANWIASEIGGESDSSEESSLVSGYIRSREMEEALDRADEVIPTRYLVEQNDSLDSIGNGTRAGTKVLEADAAKVDADRLNRFTALWTWAEKLKIAISEMLVSHQRDAPREVALDFEGRIEVHELLRSILERTQYQDSIDRMLDSFASNTPLFTVRIFRDLAQASIDPSVKLAASMAKSALSTLDIRDAQSDESSKIPVSVQSIVMSGRAAALPRVAERINEEFEIDKAESHSPQILFRSRYAKSATAIGACRARHRIATAFQRSGRPEQLEGQCEMDLRIENLFFYLPCAYQLGDANSNLKNIVFGRHDEFRRIGQAEHGVIRSIPSISDHTLSAPDEFFEQPQRETRLYRNDGDGNGIIKGLLSVDDLVSRADLRDESEIRDLRRESDLWRVRYEIDYLHRLSMLFIRPYNAESDPPRYRVNYTSPSPLKEPDVAVEAVAKVKALLASAEETLSLHAYLGQPDVGRTPLCAEDQWLEISVFEDNVATDNDERQHGHEEIRAWISPRFQQELNRQGRLQVYLSVMNGQKTEILQNVTFAPEAVTDVDGASVGFRADYRLMIVSDGRIVLVIGDEPAYWETTDVRKWLSLPPGCVLRQRMETPMQPIDWWNDPFCGRH